MGRWSFCERKEERSQRRLVENLSKGTHRRVNAVGFRYDKLTSQLPIYSLNIKCSKSSHDVREFHSTLQKITSHFHHASDNRLREKRFFCTYIDILHRVVAASKGVRRYVYR
ncbi:Protein of unknown function [Pyronema omphalodes CBS 100304]|uniref:Uncharacterized protein n=1 Tax=Pyronema omphalodes (strain CBS 100304) TaxID=1076935 RepID=U4LWG6_PYROM|nr:Protein of unknown function [Pyronema omphalodes CBS 100304]